MYGLCNWQTHSNVTNLQYELAAVKCQLSSGDRQLRSRAFIVCLTSQTELQLTGSLTSVDKGYRQAYNLLSCCYIYNWSDIETTETAALSVCVAALPKWANWNSRLVKLLMTMPIKLLSESCVCCMCFLLNSMLCVCMLYKGWLK